MILNKIVILVGLFISLILIGGCNDGTVFLNATSTGDCAIKCKNLTRFFNYNCMTVNAYYETTIINNKLIENSCECILFDCFKKIK